MRRMVGGFDTIIHPDNLWAAWLDFRRGKRHRPTVRRFEVRAAQHIHRLHRALRAESYRPEGYRLKVIYEPKLRLIAAAPVRDRVVHHAIHRVLSPPLDRRLIDSTFACLPGRGSHRAVLAFQRGLRRHRYVLLLDIARYFPSVDGEILVDLLGQWLKGRATLDLLARIVRTGTELYGRPEVRTLLGLSPNDPRPGCGLPIGNLTSQWWANHYLSGLDHALKRQLKLSYVQRYMDDYALFGDDKAELAAARDWTSAWLWEHRALRLKDPAAPVRSTRQAFTYLGYRVTRDAIRVAGPAVARAEERVRSLVARGDEEKADRSLASYRGWLSFPARPPPRRP